MTHDPSRPLDRLARGLRLAAARTGAGRAAARDAWAAGAAALAWATIAAAVAIVMEPWARNLATYGFHDWDSQTAHRYLVKLSLLRHHEMPWWNPYQCGGFPAWGYVEAATTVVSPWLPAYLLLPMSVALRVEVLGMALLGAIGAYRLAGRFTESHAARALVVALWAVNGRWGLQTAAGHTWHLAYAWLPWCFLFFERAREPAHAAAGGEPESSRVRDIALSGACFAMLVYAGGIYPLPHTVLTLGLYALGMSIATRSPRPLLVLGACGLAGVGLAAPKLLPLLDTFGKAPRLIDSTETMDLGAALTMLTSRDQAFHSRPARVSPYGWHEWGIYVGGAGVLAMVLGVALVQGRREAVLEAVGLLLVVLGFGAFHPAAPWALLHAHVPVFRSQHVPSRFLYPAVLVLGLVAAAGLGRAVARAARRRPWIDAVACTAALALAIDIALVARKPMQNAMWMVPPRIPEGRPFHFVQEPPFHYKKRDWAGPVYLAMLGNTGVINCYGVPPFDRKGAKPVSHPAYRGEAYLDGEGSASIAAFGPNSAEIDVTGASPGALLVYNMNYDEGWTARVEQAGSSGRAAPVVARDDVVAVEVPAGSSRVTLRYRPPMIGYGLAIFVATAGALAAVFRRQARIDRGEPA